MTKNDAIKMFEYALLRKTQDYKVLGVCYDTNKTRYGYGVRLIDVRTMEVTERYACTRESLHALLTEVKTDWDRLTLSRDGRFSYL